MDSDIDNTIPPLLLSIKTPNLLLLASKDQDKVQKFIENLFPDAYSDYIKEKYGSGNILRIYQRFDDHNKLQFIMFLLSFCPEDYKIKKLLEVEQLLDFYIYIDCYLTRSIRSYLIKNLPPISTFKSYDTYLKWDDLPMDVKLESLKEYKEKGYPAMVTGNYYRTVNICK